MKAVLSIALFVLVPLFALMSLNGEAAASPPAPLPAAVLSHSSPAGQTTAECLQKCREQLTENLKACKANCWICTLEVLWICVSGHYGNPCFSNCNQGAMFVFEACARGCLQPEPAN